MKKQLVASLAAAMVLSVAGTSFAAANPFVDVPAKHWSYDAVTKLAQAGIVDGYGDGTYQGDKMISRYEMAQIVAKAMARSDKADASQKAAIDKLSVEFASELEGLNVRVTKIEKNASSVKVTGHARLRFQDTFDKQDSLGGAKQADKNLQLRSRLFVSGNINDQWKYSGRIENVQDMYTSSADTETKINSAYITGPIAGVNATFGRFDITPVYGYVMDDSLKGAKLSFGNVVKANVYYGKTIEASSSSAKMLASAEKNLYGMDLKYATSKATNLVGGYWEYDAKDVVAAETTRGIWEAGFDTKITSDLVLNAEYIKSDANTENKAYVAGLTYKAANKTKVDSYSVWANYRNFKKNVVVDNLGTLDNILLGSDGGKGYEVGFNYVPMMNTLLTVKYVDTKATAPNMQDKAKFFRAQAEFWF